MFIEPVAPGVLEKPGREVPVLGTDI